MDIKRDDYIFLDIEWKTGFKHTSYCRGYNLTSHIKSIESLYWVKKFTWRVVTKKQYEDKLWVSFAAADTELKSSKTPTTSSAKASPSAKKVTPKPSATKASVPAAKKNTKKQVSSSKAKKTPSVGLEKETNNERRASKGKALKENPAKGDSRTKASKDSKAVSKPQRASKPAAKRTTPSSKEARTELREPKVRNVRKPKKDVQGTDDPRKTPSPRTRSSKGQTKQRTSRGK